MATERWKDAEFPRDRSRRLPSHADPSTIFILPDRGRRTDWIENGPWLTQPGAPVRCRENSACIPRQLSLRALPFSMLLGLSRLSRHRQESVKQSQLSSPTCASLREALPWHRQARTSSIRLTRAEKLLLLGSWLAPV